MLDLFSQRRQNIGQQVKDILASRGPLPAYKREALDALLREASDLERGIDTETERRKLDAFSQFLRLGREDTGVIKRVSDSRIEIRDLGESGMGTGVATGSGALVPVAFSNMVDEALKQVGPLTDGSVVTFDDTEHGRNLDRPSDNDTSIAATIIGEGQQNPMQDIPVLGQQVLGAFKLSSGLIKVSIELMGDAGFDFPAYLARKLAVRIGRGLNPLLTTGTGTNQPKGIVTSIIAQGNTVTSSLLGNPTPQVPTPDDFATLEASVDPIYRPNASWQCSSSTLAYLRKATDTVGNPAFKQLHSDNVAEDYVFGYPIRVNNALDNLQTVASSPVVSRNVLLFGDFKQFRVRRVTPILYRLGERFAEFGQVAFLLLQRYDCALCDGGGGSIKCLQVTY